MLELWLPIILSAVAVHIASFLAWCVTGHHDPDIQQFPAEDELLDLVRAQEGKRGLFMFPYCSNKDRKNEEAVARYMKGPHGTINLSGPPSMGKNMGLTILFFLIVSVLVAYVTTMATLGDRLAVFQLTATVAVMAYTMAGIPNAIWFAKPRRAILMDVIDGVVFGLITGGIFAALYKLPEAPVTLP